MELIVTQGNPFSLIYQGRPLYPTIPSNGGPGNNRGSDFINSRLELERLGEKEAGEGMYFNFTLIFEEWQRIGNNLII